MTKSMEYRTGYRDALELIEALGDNSEAVDMAAHAEPPAMPAEYREGFRAAVKVMRKVVSND